MYEQFVTNCSFFYSYASWTQGIPKTFINEASNTGKFIRQECQIFVLYLCQYRMQQLFMSSCRVRYSRQPKVLIRLRMLDSIVWINYGKVQKLGRKEGLVLQDESEIEKTSFSSKFQTWKSQIIKKKTLVKYGKPRKLSKALKQSHVEAWYHLLV